ncbi:DUF1249 domain-containing protein [Nitrincola tapanii]|uniref:DUF1249 domain-containing protein n=1 Tax=Nitrincola tapanii TaxID=1708751 RepID=A0A5A9W6T9_9GAMM|nr:DUF1249 domain-containing protein [Nitrincola tapanii]KAA0876510.1 DUF1249 domain-containing protein [Nitrincola tapanii]
MKAKYVPDLTRQMALGQSNYLRLYKLLPDLTAGVRREFELASSRGHQRIRLEVEEEFRYTSTVVMGVQEGHASPWLQSPELVIRLYHDARLAEVVCARRRRQLSGVYPYPNPQMHQPDEKRQLNEFLGEWLNQCLSYGLETQKVLI